MVVFNMQRYHCKVAAAFVFLKVGFEGSGVLLSLRLTQMVVLFGWHPHNIC